jgi:hypothetical protein
MTAADCTACAGPGAPAAPGGARTRPGAPPTARTRHHPHLTPLLSSQENPV